MSSTYHSRKVLKLATALYMITDIMSEKEPLKWHLRHCAVDLLESKGHELRGTIERTIDILAIARIARAVSAMNADVLEAELTLLHTATEAGEEEEEKGAHLLSKAFFDIPQTLSAPKTDTLPSKDEPAKVAPLISKEPEHYFPPVKPAQSAIIHTPTPKPFDPYKAVYQKKETKEEERQPERPATTLIPQGIRTAFPSRTTLLDDAAQSRPARSDESKKERREVILAAIREKGVCSIKDISKKLSHVSEKTIQRELVAMTDEKILIKEGDRRWSTYRLA